MRIVAQRELGAGVQEIVAVDTHVGVTDVLQAPMVTTSLGGGVAGWTFQAPKTLHDGRLMAYRFKPGEQFNLNVNAGEVCVFESPDVYKVVQRPSTPAKFGRQNAVNWIAHGHAAPTSHDTLIHAACELESWWLFGIPVRKQWVCVETDLTGRPTGARWVDQAEPSWTDRGLTRIDTSGTGAVVTPDRRFDKASSPIGAKSFGWFDPHLSPNGRQVVWLDLVAVGLGVISGLILGDVATGQVRYIVAPTVLMQSDAMWVDDQTLIGARFIDKRWRLVLIDTLSSRMDVVPNTEDCLAVHVSI